MTFFHYYQYTNLTNCTFDDQINRGGKVLVSTQEHIDRLVAARLAADVLGVEMIIVARTDAEAATLLDCNYDGRDHPFIIGATVPGSISLSDAIANATASGGGDVASIEKEWTAKARPMTFGEAVLDKIHSLPIDEGRKRSMISRWEASDPDSLSNGAAHRVADAIFGKKNSIYFDWEACRVREGYYRIKPGIEYCVRRGRAYSPYADLIWMETVSVHTFIIIIISRFSRCLTFNHSGNDATGCAGNSRCSQVLRGR